MCGRGHYAREAVARRDGSNGQTCMMGKSFEKEETKETAAKRRGEGVHEGSAARRRATAVGLTGEGVRRRKKRVWVNPKDKTNARKAFLKVRDAKARSRFEKLRKKQRGETGDFEFESAPLKKTGISEPDSHEAFLDRLLDPFASPSFEPKEEPSTKRLKKRRNGAGHADTSDEPSAKVINNGGDEANRTSCGQASQVKSKPFATTGKKEYAPFVQARKKFEEAKKAAEAAAAAASAEAAQRELERRKRQRDQKVTRRKLRARSSRGQPLMGDVMDVLLRRIQQSCADSDTR